MGATLPEKGCGRPRIDEETGTVRIDETGTVSYTHLTLPTSDLV